MTIETATLLAVLAAPLAVLAVVAAVTVRVAAAHGRVQMGRSATALDRREQAIRAELVSARTSMERTATAIGRVRGMGRRMDVDLESWTAGMASRRRTVEQLERSRFGPAVRTMRLAGALARVALLWRAPAR